MNNTLFIIRGLPGAGKSTLAQTLVPAGRDLAADDYMHQDLDRSKPYVFEGAKVRASHDWCESTTKALMSDGTGLPVAVANTFTRRWEFEAYVGMAKECGYGLVVIDLFDGDLSDEALAARNVHGVPLVAFERMRARYEHDWRNADPRPEWER